MNNFTKENVLCINSICKDDIELKTFLFSKDIKQNKCEICSQTPTWQGKNLDMVVHRKVKKNNNLLENLMILCPNCLSQKQNIRKSFTLLGNMSEKWVPDVRWSSREVPRG